MTETQTAIPWSPNGDLPLPQRVVDAFERGPWLTLYDFAKAFGYAPHTLLKLLQRGKLAYHVRDPVTGAITRGKFRNDAHKVRRRSFTKQDAIKFWNSEERWEIDKRKGKPST